MKDPVRIQIPAAAVAVEAELHRLLRPPVIPWSITIPDPTLRPIDLVPELLQIVAARIRPDPAVHARDPTIRQGQQVPDNAHAVVPIRVSPAHIHRPARNGLALARPVHIIPDRSAPDRDQMLRATRGALPDRSGPEGHVRDHKLPVAVQSHALAVEHQHTGRRARPVR